MGLCGGACIGVAVPFGAFVLIRTRMLSVLAGTLEGRFFATLRRSANVKRLRGFSPVGFARSAQEAPMRVTTGLEGERRTGEGVSDTGRWLAIRRASKESPRYGRCALLVTRQTAYAGFCTASNERNGIMECPSRGDVVTAVVNADMRGTVLETATHAITTLRWVLIRWQDGSTSWLTSNDCERWVR